MPNWLRAIGGGYIRRPFLCVKSLRLGTALQVSGQDRRNITFGLDGEGETSTDM